MKLNELVYEATCLITESELYEMARVQEDDSGIPAIMYVSTKQVVKERHGPRIKISNIRNTFSDTDNFAVDIAKEPRVVAGTVKVKKDELEDIFDWVKLNYVPLMKYWNNEYRSDKLFYAEIKSLKEV
jgi:hypothetical protein